MSLKNFPPSYGSTVWGWPYSGANYFGLRKPTGSVDLGSVHIVSGHGPAFYPHPDDAEDQDEVGPPAASFRSYIVMEADVTVRDAVVDAEEAT